MPFDSFESVDEWVAKKAPNGANALRERLDANRFAGPNETWARAWLARHERQAAGERMTVEDDRTERMTVASEASAAAAKVSATEAKRANRRATFGLWIAGASAVVAVIAALIAWFKP